MRCTPLPCSAHGGPSCCAAHLAVPCTLQQLLRAASTALLAGCTCGSATAAATSASSTAPAGRAPHSAFSQCFGATWCAGACAPMPSLCSACGGGTGCAQSSARTGRARISPGSGALGILSRCQRTLRCHISGTPPTPCSAGGGAAPSRGVFPPCLCALCAAGGQRCDFRPFGAACAHWRASACWTLALRARSWRADAALQPPCNGPGGAPFPFAAVAWCGGACCAGTLPWRGSFPPQPPPSGCRAPAAASSTPALPGPFRGSGAFSFFRQGTTACAERCAGSQRPT